jgi:glyoxylase-like metal-dependent hydrolase (beta-lactamase superfamily II)
MTETSGVKIRCVTTGNVRPKRGERGVRRYLPGGWDTRSLPVNVFVIQHPAGTCLFDTGQTASAARHGYFPAWHPFFRLSRFELTAADEAAAQLLRLGIDPGAVRWVALSHLHTDHVGGLAAFAGAEVLVTRTEWAHARGVTGRLRGYLPQYWPRGLRPALVDFSDGPVGPFAGSFDLAGDGRLLLVPTPGHTRGHMALLIQDGERRYLCCGDAAHSAAALAATAPELDRFCREHGVVALTSHDPAASRKTAARSPVDVA